MSSAARLKVYNSIEAGGTGGASVRPKPIMSGQTMR